MTTPFLFEIVGRFGLANSTSVVVYGQVVRGTTTRGAPLDLIGFAPEPWRVTLQDMATKEGKSFHHTQLQIAGVRLQDVNRGQALAALGSFAACDDVSRRGGL